MFFTIWLTPNLVKSAEKLFHLLRYLWVGGKYEDPKKKFRQPFAERACKRHAAEAFAKSSFNMCLTHMLARLYIRRRKKDYYS